MVASARQVDRVSQQRHPAGVIEVRGRSARDGRRVSTGCLDEKSLGSGLDQPGDIARVLSVVIELGEHSGVAPDEVGRVLGDRGRREQVGYHLGHASRERLLSVSGRFGGKVVLITGTAGGQGRAAALLFAAEGAVVVGTDLNGAGAAETVDMVRAAGGRMNSTHPLDLGDEDAVQAWVDGAAASHGGIDVVYNNAGATRFSPIEATSYDDWSFVVRNELDIVFLVTKHAWRHLVARGGGSVLLVGSTAGISGSLTNARIAHTATKGAVVAMTKQLAAEGAAARHPRQLHQSGHDPYAGHRGRPARPKTTPCAPIARAIPLGRIGDPEEVARCALFLGVERRFVRDRGQPRRRWRLVRGASWSPAPGPTPEVRGSGQEAA